VLSWLVAIPVHLDPNGGLLWGSVLVAVAATSLAVEAGRAAWPAGGNVVVASAIVVLLVSQTSVVFFPVWTPWLGALWLFAALACAWAVSCGRGSWWPLSVIASSVAAQAHVVFAPTAVIVCAIGPGMAVLLARRRHAPSGLHRRSLVAGAVVGIVLWLPTVVDEIAGRPGNLTLLWETSREPGGSTGLPFSLRVLGASVSPVASWMHRLPTDGVPAFRSIFATLTNSSPRGGVVVMVVLAVVAAAAWITRRWVLAGAAAVALSAAVATVVTVAGIPRSDALELVYLTVIYWPVGMAAWIVLVSGVISLIRAGVHRLVVPSAGVDATRARSVAVAAAMVVLVSASTALTIHDAGEVPNVVTIDSGLSTIGVVDRSIPAVLRAAPHRPFQLDLDDSQVDDSVATYTALAYGLIAHGADVRLPAAFATDIGSRYDATSGEPVVTVTVPPDGVPVVRVRPAPASA
jgi:hypothetical protein